MANSATVVRKCVKCQEEMGRFSTGDAMGMVPVIVNYCKSAMCDLYGILTLAHWTPPN